MRPLIILLLCALSLGVPTVVAAQTSPSSSVRTNTVSNLEVSSEHGQTVLRIKGDQTPAFSVFKLSNPVRLFVDISNSKLKNDAIQKPVHNGLVTQVGLLQFENPSQAITRAIIGFNPDANAQYDVTTDGNDVVVVVSGKNTSANTSSTSSASYDQTRVAQLEAEIQTLRSNVASAQLNIQNGESELAQAKSEQQRLRSQIAQIQNSADTQQRARIQQLEHQLAENNKAHQKERDQLASLKALTTTQQANLSKLEKQLQRQSRLIATNNKETVASKAIEPLNTVRGLDIVSVGGKSQIIIDLDRPGAFKTTGTQGENPVMILNNVEIPKSLQRTLASDTHGGTVRFVKATSQGKTQARLEASLHTKSSELVRQSGKRLIWEFAPSMYNQLSSSEPSFANTTDTRPNYPQTRPQEGDLMTAAPPNKSIVVTNPTEISTIPGMKRKRITLDSRNADIQNIMRMIASEGGINIVTSSNVTGNITIKLSSVPLDEVFLTVLQSQSLGFEKRGNVFRVAPQSDLIAEQKARLEAKKTEREVRPLELFLLPVRYADASSMTQQVSGLISERGSVTVDNRTNTLVIKDVADNLDAIKELVASLDSQVPQVLIEARIVETSDTFAREFGIQWGGDASFSQANGNPTGLLFPSVLGVTGGTSSGSAPPGVSSNPNFAVNLPVGAGLGSGGALGLTLGSIGGAVNLNLRLTALEETGHAKIVSAPQIMAMDNQSASISQGVSIPISVVSSAGAQTTFVEASLALTVTPSVTPDGNVRLKINATKNEPDFQRTGASGDPSIISRTANTELMIRDGDTTVIGGIYTSNTGSSSSGVPFLKDIPILGYLFRKSSTSNRRSELLIFITPRIVNRAESIGAGGETRTTTSL